MNSRIRFAAGEPVPWFIGRTATNKKFHFSTCAGRYLVLCFFESADSADSRRVLADVVANRDRFDDDQACFFGVTTDPADEHSGRVRDHLPGIRFFFDGDRQISRLYGAETVASSVTNAAETRSEGYFKFSIVLDERLRTLTVIPFGDSPGSHVARLLEVLDRQPRFEPTCSAALQAPVLIVPRIFEPEFCRELIELYERHGGEESGFMRDQNGQTVAIVDYGHKRREDYTIADEAVRIKAMHRIHDRLAPEIAKAFQFQATRMERYIVACYEADKGGHFRPHRDNTTKGTSHRRFAVSLNLNSEEYDGGNLRFPEYGRWTYRPPTGGACVFSCSLLHEATPVTRGARYVFLPFLYDDAAARIRQANEQFLANNAPRPREIKLPVETD